MKYFMTILLLIIVLTGCDNKDDTILHVESYNDVSVADIDSDDDITVSNEENTNNDASVPEESSVMIGVWHDMPMVGSGLSQRYHFYDDGSFVFEYSQFDETKTTLSESGKWTFINDLLSLEITEKITVVGGEKTESKGRIVIVIPTPPEKKEYTVHTPLSLDKEVSPDGYYTFDIEGIEYWRISSDPDMYRDPQYKDGDIYN